MTKLLSRRLIFLIFVLLFTSLYLLLSERRHSLTQSFNNMFVFMCHLHTILKSSYLFLEVVYFPSFFFFYKVVFLFYRCSVFPGLSKDISNRFPKPPPTFFFPWNLCFFSTLFFVFTSVRALCSIVNDFLKCLMTWAVWSFQKCGMKNLNGSCVHLGGWV